MSLSNDEVVAISRFLSTVLGHEPEMVGIRLDSQGWVRLQELIHGIRQAARSPGASKRLRTLPEVTLDRVHEVVAGNSKQRFALSPDGERIRAVQGHSVEINLAYAPAEPPPILFHGTASTNWPSIASHGLRRGGRHAVHLSADLATARAVGLRHGRLLVLEVAAQEMQRDGFQFTRADNGTWLVDSVPSKYLHRMN
jgi:putative RNA 2'-phosphotransferase